MSHDDIRAALESRSDLPWRPSHGGPVATRPSDTYDVYDCDGDVIAASLFYLDAHLIAHAPTWLAELLAEVDALTTRAEAAEQTNQRVRECAQQALEFADRTMDDNAAHWARVAAADILRALDGGAS